MISPLDDAAGLERVTATLRRFPAVDAHAADRIVSAALHRRRIARRRRTWLAAAAALALAAGLGVGGVALHRDRTGTGSAPDVALAPAAAPQGADAAPSAAQLATARAGEEAPVQVPFALHRPGARRVALVGDFDGWSPTAIPMTRGADGTWTVSAELPRGRHAYAFVVDDTLWVTDPRAQTVRDADYGRDQSIVIVGEP